MTWRFSREAESVGLGNPYGALRWLQPRIRPWHRGPSSLGRGKAHHSERSIHPEPQSLHRGHGQRYGLGFQFKIKVIGEGGAPWSVIIKNRPSGETA